MKINGSFSVSNPEIFSGELEEEVYHQSVFAAQQAQQEKVETGQENARDTTGNPEVKIKEGTKKINGRKIRRKSCKHEILFGHKCEYCMSLPEKCGNCHFCVNKHLKKACMYRKCQCNCF